MASINYHTREISCKIVYYGPGLSGKTTNLQIIHKKVPKDSKSEMVSLATETDRTLFFDFLPLDLGSIKGFSTKFQLYTVPGQVYYNATRKLVLRGVDGVVFVADSQRDKMPENLESLRNLEENLREYGIELKTTPFVLQYNKRDLPSIFSIEEMNAQINSYGVPCYEAQAHQGVGVFTTLKAIGKIVIDTFNTKYSARQSSRRPDPSPSSQGSTIPAVPSAPALAPMAPPPAPSGLRMPPPPAAPPASGFSAPAPRPIPAPAPPPVPQSFMPPPAAPSFVPPAPQKVMAPPPSIQPAFAPAPQGFVPSPAPMAPPPVPAPIPTFVPPAPAATQGIQSALVSDFGMDLPTPQAAAAQPPVQVTGFAAPPAAPAAPIGSVPGLQNGFFQAPAPAAPPPMAAAPQAPSGRKERLDGTMDPRDLDAEIARMERELLGQPQAPAAAAPVPPAAGIQTNPNVNPNMDTDPAFTSAFLSPDEIRQFQQSTQDYPTQRLPMNPGNP